MMLRENEPTTIKLSTSVTGGQFVIFESTTSPGNGPRLHKHHDQDEWWYVLDGEFIFQIGEEKFCAKPGRVLKRRTPGVRILEDPQTRQVTKALTGADEFLNFCLISTMQWLEQNPTLTRELTKAMVRTLRWVHSHKPEEVRDPLPSSLRTQDKERHLESLRILMDGTSKDGRMPPEAPAGVLRYVGVTNEKVRNAKIDLSAT